ncbi:DEAD/DEAH box helicase [Pseudonocardia sichuanensis]
MAATVIGELTADASTIILMGTGPEHEVAQAAAKLQTLTPLIKPTDPAGALQLPATWPAVVQLATTFGAAWRPGPALTAWIGEQVGNRGAQPDELLVKPPPGLVPRSYQIEAAAMIRASGSALLFDEPGTGKTASTILGLVERAAAGHDVLPVVVVCPAAVIDSWVSHVRDWAPRWRATAWRGTPDRRRRLSGSADVYVASYDTARRDAGETDVRKSPLLALRARTVVADEVHKIKGQATEQSRAVRRLAGKARGFIGLSGTPITHHPGDLWPALMSLEPGAWPSRERWVARYCWTVQGDYAATVLGLRDDAEPEFRTALLGRHRRVAKADVLAELPPKVYSVRTVELPTEWRKAYDSLESQMLAELPDGTELSVMGVLAQLTRLAQLSSAAADIETTTETVDEGGLVYEKTHQHVHLKAPSWKVDALLEVTAERPGEQVVAFAPSRQLIVLAGKAATDAGLRVGYVMGGQTAAERTGYIDAFQRGELDLICVTTGAGGVGLTLTAARTAVFLQRPWSLVEALQSEDRLHRIGAERHESIEVIDIVARKTIDSRVRSILRERAGQLADLVQDPRIVAELLGGAGVRDLRKGAAA